MPTTDVTNSLIASITSAEQSTGNVPINRSTGGPTFASNVGQFSSYVALAAGTTVIPLPINPITQLYFRNIDPSKTIALGWAPNNGTLVTVLTLNPGDQVIVFASPTGPTNPGIIEVSVTPSAAGALCEYFLGG